MFESYLMVTGADDLLAGVGHHGKHGAEHHDPGEERDAVVAEPEHERVQRGVLALPHVDRVRDDEAPAGAGIPGVLGERLEPDAIVAEPLKDEAVQLIRAAEEGQR